VVALYTFPLMLEPGVLLPNHHDPQLFGWVMLTIFRNLASRPWMLFEGNAFYPFGNSLTYRCRWRSGSRWPSTPSSASSRTGKDATSRPFWSCTGFRRSPCGTTRSFAIRVATRLGVLVVFAGALLAGLGMAWLCRRLPSWAQPPSRSQSKSPATPYVLHSYGNA
jgi:hypothetical protein